MAKNAELHINSQFLVLLSPKTITTAIGATATTAITKLGGTKYLAAQASFVYGSGGTNATAYVQTSLDGGLSWIDLIAFQFTTASAVKVQALSVDFAPTSTASSQFAPIAPTDGTLTANTAVQGLFGDRIRLKYVTTGTYAGGTTLAVYCHVKG